MNVYVENSILPIVTKRDSKKLFWSKISFIFQIPIWTVTFQINEQKARLFNKNKIQLRSTWNMKCCIKLAHSQTLPITLSRSYFTTNRSPCTIYYNQHSMKQCTPRWICHALKNNLHIICHARDTALAHLTHILLIN